MNLKSKLTARATSVVRFIDDTNCIFSDECSPTHIDALTIMSAATKEELWTAVKAKAAATASATRFQGVILVITPENKLVQVALPKRQAAPDPEYAV